MTRWRFLVRSLWWHRRAGLLVVLAAALASAIMTGAFIAGGSMSATLRQRASSRLGAIDHIITAPRFLRPELARQITQDSQSRIAQAAPLLLLPANARNPDTSAAVGVQVIGLDQAMADLFDSQALPPLAPRQAAINQSLALDLGLAPGDAMILRVDASPTAAGSLFTEQRLSRTRRGIRVQVSAVLSDQGPGGFSLENGSIRPRNVLLDRAWLENALGLAPSCNAIALAVEPEAYPAHDPSAILTRHVTLEDHGLRLDPDPKGPWLTLRAHDAVLNQAQVSVAVSTAEAQGGQGEPASAYLATRVQLLDHPTRTLAYAVMASAPLPLNLHFVAGSDPTLAGGHAWLNQWAAEDLQAQPGDRLLVTYLIPQSDGTFTHGHLETRIQNLVALDGAAADPNLFPIVAGLTDADQMDQWDPPFPVDLQQVTPRDEEYWKRWRATPKLFLPPSDLQAMWQAGPGRDWITAVRLRPPPGFTIEAWAPGLEAALGQALPFTASGLAVRPVRAEALAAAAGSTDFRSLFVGLSLFLVVAAAALAGLVMRLMVHQRAKEAGILQAMGFPESQVSRMLHIQGIMLTLIGTAVGVPLGLAYAAALIEGLNRLWPGTDGRALVQWHVTWADMAWGSLLGLLAGLLGVCSGVAWLRRQGTLPLLRGWRALGVARPPAGWSLPLALTLACLALTTLGLGLWGEERWRVTAFFIGGAGFLATAILAGHGLMRRKPSPGPGALSMPLLAWRGIQANPGRSLLVAALFALSSLILTAVAAQYRQAGPDSWIARDSGGGGFSLWASSALPLRATPQTAAGRAALGFEPEDEILLASTRFFPLARSQGDDASCLNIGSPVRPRVLSIPPTLIERGGFAIRTAVPVADNPWHVLQTSGDEAIPVFADADSARWILHRSLGEVFTIPDGQGLPIRLRMAGWVEGSIFANSLLMDQGYFQELFPHQQAVSEFLVETPLAEVEAVAALLRRRLGSDGVEIRTTQEILGQLLAVQNAYVSIFLALGGLGIMLGALGLLIVLFRNVWERRAELALLQALGIGRRRLVLMLTLETAGLLAAGLVCGAVAGLLSVAPALTMRRGQSPWTALTLWLMAIAATGLLACVAAAASALRRNLLNSLRAD